MRRCNRQHFKDGEIPLCRFEKLASPGGICRCGGARGGGEKGGGGGKNVFLMAEENCLLPSSLPPPPIRFLLFYLAENEGNIKTEPQFARRRLFPPPSATPRFQAAVLCA